MQNMSYCMFNNTALALRECIDVVDEPCSAAEHKRRIALIRMCAELVIDFAGVDCVEDAVNWAKSLPVEE